MAKRVVTFGEIMLRLAPEGYYRFVQATLRGSSLYGEAIETEYDPKRYLRLCAKNILLSVVTCGIWLPWMVVSLIRYFASPVIHRLFLCEEPIYRGRGSVLFAYGVLFGVVPVVIIPFAAACFVLTGGMAVSGVLLLIVAVGLLACLKALTLRYFVNFEVGRKRLCTTIRSWRAGGFVFGQFLLLVLTCGIYAPMALLRIWRYYADRTVLGEERVEIRFGFSSNGLRDYGRLLLQWLLVAVTAGLYFPWGYARTMDGGYADSPCFHHYGCLARQASAEGVSSARGTFRRQIRTAVLICLPVGFFPRKL